MSKLRRITGIDWELNGFCSKNYRLTKVNGQKKKKERSHEQTDNMKGKKKRRQNKNINFRTLLILGAIYLIISSKGTFIIIIELVY